MDKKLQMYSEGDWRRVKDIPPKPANDREDYRTPLRKDFGRIVHSPCFRRLQGKTQLYPGKESDFFRNRLTHSVEVAQIAKSIAIRINSKFIDEESLKIEPDLSELAGLAHDLGHPPFGHTGEKALDIRMHEFGGFEGNAQTLRLLSKIEKKDKPRLRNHIDDRTGLNLTFRTLASILKYDNTIPFSVTEREEFAGEDQKIKVVKGYYNCESELVKQIKQNVLGTSDFDGRFKTIECQIMDIADDIAYATYDLEDALKAGFFNPLDGIFSDDVILEKVAKYVNRSLHLSIKSDKVIEVLFNLFKNFFALKPKTDRGLGEIYKFIVAIQAARSVASDGYKRSKFTSNLIGKFIRGIEFELNEKFPPLSKVKLNEDVLLQVEVLKNLTFVFQIISPRVKLTEFRGKEIVTYLFDTLANNDGKELLPHDYQELFEKLQGSDRKRVICDFIAGMTDSYAVEFYGRLTSEKPETIFKPH